VAASVLERIVAGVREDLAQAKKRTPEEMLRLRAVGRRKPPGFREALTRGLDKDARAIRIIAEVKLASPSRGYIARGANPGLVAQAYAANGAAAISVLTERRHFAGSLETLEDVAKVVPVPVLRKDFIIDPYQLVEAAAYGASAVLLIAALHSSGDLYALIDGARALGLEVLVEVHDETEIERAVKSGADVIGVNNRDLKTLVVDHDTARRLAPLIPNRVTRVAESGIKKRADIDRLMESGYRAFLIGEGLMETGSPGATLAELLGGPKR
jgi:indole-3-glycerol phosphate synthase